MPTPRKSREPIPAAGVIRLSVAFTQFYRTMVPRSEKLDAAAEKELAGNRGAKPGQSKGRVMRLRDKTVKRAELKFREHLAAEILIAQMRDPNTGERVTVVNPEDWTARHNFGVPGFGEDYVWTGDPVQPGPDAMIRGELQPVFFVQPDFDSFIGRIEAVTGNIKEVHPRAAGLLPVAEIPLPGCALPAGELDQFRAGDALLAGGHLENLDRVAARLADGGAALDGGASLGAGRLGLLLDDAGGPSAKNDPTSVAEEAEARLAATQSSREPEADFHILPSNQPTQRARARAWQALKFLFQDGKIPKHLSISYLTGRVNSWLSKQSGNIADRPKVGESTVARVLGQKK